MNIRACLTVAAALAVFGAAPAGAAEKLSIAIMPAQHFASDEPSAENFTKGLAREFRRQDYKVIPLRDSRDKFDGMGLSPSRHYPDRVALKFGQSMGADLVAYPRVLTVGNTKVRGKNPVEASAVVHLRILNVRTGKEIYMRQVAQSFRPEFSRATLASGRPARPVLTESGATAAADKITDVYWEKVAGSRQETGG